VPATDHKAAAHAVMDLRDEKTRRRLIKAGTDRARSYSAADYVQGVLDFLDEFEETTLRSWR
jgi:hypothetical protein